MCFPLHLYILFTLVTKMCNENQQDVVLYLPCVLLFSFFLSLFSVFPLFSNMVSELNRPTPIFRSFMLQPLLKIKPPLSYRTSPPSAEPVHKAKMQHHQHLLNSAVPSFVLQPNLSLRHFFKHLSHTHHLCFSSSLFQTP